MIAKYRWQAALIGFAVGGMLGGVDATIYHFGGSALVPLAMAVFVVGIVVAEAMFYLIAKRFQFGLVLRESHGQPDGPANGSQPIRSETNRTSSAAGSRR